LLNFLKLEEAQKKIMIHQTFSLKIMKKINQLATHAKLGGRFMFLKSVA